MIQFVDAGTAAGFAFPGSISISCRRRQPRLPSLAPPGPPVPKPDWRRARNREYDERRHRDKPWRSWYKKPRWVTIRAAQLQKQPLCERCLSRGTITPATVCHHVDRHEGDPVKFWNGPFASSCSDCHDVDEQRIERGGRARQQVGEDGWPVDDSKPLQHSKRTIT